MSINKDNVAKIWLTDTAIWIKLKDGREAKENFTDYPLLSSASQSQRERYSTSYYGIHWPELDEDLSFEGFF